MISEIRFAIRLLLKKPGFTLVALTTLALCVGANSAIFSAVYTLMLKPLPYSEPGRIVEIYNTYDGSKASSNIVQYLDYRDNAGSFANVGLCGSYQAFYGLSGSDQRLWGARTTADFFAVLAVNPILGRYYTAENSRSNEDKVIVLSHAFWVTQFQEDPEVVGKTAHVDGETVTIVGVAPRALESFDARVRFFRPLSWDPAKLNPQARHANSMQLLGRLKPGIPLERAQSEADSIERRFYEGSPPPTRAFIDRTHARVRIGLVQLERVRPVKATLLMLQCGVALVLLIGCVNIANLLLARANGRQSELATRISLGASRVALARQLLVETMVLTLLGGALGTAIAWSIIAAINHFRAQFLPTSVPFALDGQVLGFTLTISVVAAVLISVAPVVHVLRTNLIELIHRASRNTAGHASARAVSGVLIVGQVAIALMLLTGAGLLVRSFMNAISVDPGFEPQGVVSGRIALPRAYRASDDAARAFRDRLHVALQEIPGVSSVALALSTPFQGGVPANAVTLAEDRLPPGSPQPGAFRVQVSPEYLATLQLRMLEGRFLEASDATGGNRSFVVDEEFARKYFPDRSALGGRLSFAGRPNNEADWPTIVGVVRKVPHNGVEDRSDLPFVYQLVDGRPSGLAVFVRTSRPTGDVIATIRETVRKVDPSIALFDTGDLQTIIDASYGSRRVIMFVLAAFAALALFLSALGLYGVLAYDVSQRTREIGVRTAVGASARQIESMVMKQGLWKVVLGLAFGTVGAVFLSRAMRSMLFGLGPGDPWVYALASFVLVAVGALASYIPARRAARIDPLEALRSE